MGEREDRRNLTGKIEKMVRLLESKAKVAGVMREEYASGIANGKYPPIGEDEVDAFSHEQSPLVAPVIYKGPAHGDLRSRRGS